MLAFDGRDLEALVKSVYAPQATIGYDTTSLIGKGAEGTRARNVPRGSSISTTASTPLSISCSQLGIVPTFARLSRTLTASPPSETWKVNRISGRGVKE
ncbi:hypothetical protein PG996_006748 [Apiospora saccharicola]|uniref:Uncharacterized protein n=1 Tax=Apiospora saccharicola TaxID=335842 RepID=A0ABR1V8W7_9PEZI